MEDGEFRSLGPTKIRKKKIEGQSGHGQGNKLNGCSF